MFGELYVFINPCQSVLISQKTRDEAVVHIECPSTERLCCCWAHCPRPLSAERSLIYYAKAHAVIQVSFLQSQSIICCSLVTQNANTLPHPPGAQFILVLVLLLALPIAPSLSITLHKYFVETLVLKSRLIVIQLEQSTGPCSWIIIDTKGLSAGDLGER